MHAGHRVGLAPAIAAIRQRWGMQALAVGTQELIAPDRIFIPTGFAALDQVLVRGGIPSGAVTELVGAPTSGLHTLTMQIIAQAQTRGLPAVYLDDGTSFTPAAALRCGVQLADLLLVRPPDAATSLAILQAIIRYGGGGVAVIDATAPRASLAANARTLAMALSQLRPTLVRTGWALILLTTL